MQQRAAPYFKSTSVNQFKNRLAKIWAILRTAVPNSCTMLNTVLSRVGRVSRV